jgi:hypothetical protein
VSKARSESRESKTPEERREYLENVVAPDGPSPTLDQPVSRPPATDDGLARALRAHQRLTTPPPPESAIEILARSHGKAIIGFVATIVGGLIVMAVYVIISLNREVGELKGRLDQRLDGLGHDQEKLEHRIERLEDSKAAAPPPTGTKP